MKHIFVVDDEKNIREILHKYLEKEGYRVTSFSGSEHVLEETWRLKPDLIVLDIMMAGVDGLELCKQIRLRSDVPIIFVSARDEELDRILGLELGGDDYLTKPFSPRELIVRIKNIWKRMDQSAVRSHHEISYQNLLLKTEARIVEVDGEPMKLTGKEHDLLSFLLQHPDQAFEREALIQSIWGYSYTGDGRMVDDLVKRLRKKVNEAGGQVEISTVWGYGYRLVER